jgi:uncharacterized protein YegP (UPF0339 family)
MKKMIIEYYKDIKKAWRFRLKSPNGKILASSEAYSSLAKSKGGLLAIIDATSFTVEYPKEK